MKQVLQHARNGEIAVADVPMQKVMPGCALVQIAASLVSAGTERASSEFAKKSLLQKAKARPDLVTEVIGKFRRDGVLSTINAVKTRLDQPSALGYSSAGTVIAVGDHCAGFDVGDRVACAGAGYAVHAEYNCVPSLLLTRIPVGSSVGFEEAAFTTLGAVALHGIRTAEARVGDVIGVIGLGLLGQLTVQILKAAGCRVIGYDLQPERATLAGELGADDATFSADRFTAMCHAHSGGFGADAVLITAETQSSDPVNLAADVARDRGVIVAVGTVGMELQRKLYYEKELTFRVSRSYGPGRYDSAYEQKGRDYPIGYVRWTETRNMEAFLRLLAEKKVNVNRLITHRFPVENAIRAYELLSSGSPSLGVLITYSGKDHAARAVAIAEQKSGSHPADVRVGMLGAGMFACTTLIPAIRADAGTALVGICAANGSHSQAAASKFSFQHCSDNENSLLDEPAINTIVIATRHHLHASQIAQALRAGKHVFCEKPLCITESELADLCSLYQGFSQPPLLMLGFNRRFAPMTVRLKSFLSEIPEPLSMQYRVNAGSLPADHWMNDPEQGGGRIIGEMCHFIDLLAFLAGCSPLTVETHSLGNEEKNCLILMRFQNGSQGTIQYMVNGDRSFSKERLEVFGGGCTAVLEDFRRLDTMRNARRTTSRSWLRQDKGHRAEWEAFANAIRTGASSPIPFEQLITSTLATFRAVESLKTGKQLEVASAWEALMSGSTFEGTAEAVHLRSC